MPKPTYHIFICNSYRVKGDPQGVCNKKNAIDLLAYVENEILERGLDAQISSTGCLKVCDKGPVMVIYPNSLWYGDINEERIDEILDGLEDGNPIEDYQIFAD